MRRRVCALLLALGVSACSHGPEWAAPSPITPPTLAPVVRGANFDQVFWNTFVHNTLDAPGSSEPLRRLTHAPMIFLSTMTDAGVLIDDATLATVETTIRTGAADWAGGAFGIAGVQRGIGTREGQPGWLTVRFVGAASGHCGRATVGVDGGYLELDVFTANCGCGASKIRPRSILHELGHAFGYWHTDAPTDVMFHLSLTCEATPSARELYHASIAYQSPLGTTTALGSGILVP